MIKYIMNNLNIIRFVFLYLFWLILTQEFSISNMMIGFITCILVTLLTTFILYSKDQEKLEIPSLFCMLRFVIRVMFEIYKSSFTYILRIIKKDCNPVFVEITLNTNNQLIITLIGNAITLTPGTLTVFSEKNKLIVLSIYDPVERDSDLALEIKEKYERIFIKGG